MNFLLVDEEQRCLDELRCVLEKVAPGCVCTVLTSSAQVLEQARSHPFDVAFLEIQTQTISGLTLAKQLREIQPTLPIIFVTGSPEYALSAFSIHANGYLLKPVSMEDIRRELTFLFGEKPLAPVIEAKMFGGFELLVDGQPLVFKRAKSKELLACLIDRRGAGLTTREACNLLWEDGVYSTARKNYFQTIVHDLRQTLSKAGIESLLIKSHNRIAIDTSMLDCDSYRLLDGDPQAISSYRHDYLPGYSWAEFTIGKLERL
ncbi:MAG: response regulator [Butyricicoccus sp.]|nr:response regulator [Butyricicoccus sp.]